MLGDKVHGHVHCEAARRFFGLGECTGVARRFSKITVHFNALDELSAALVGRGVSEETFAEAGRLAAEACEPVTDVRGTEAYKRHLASELTIRTLRTSAERVGEQRSA